MAHRQRSTLQPDLDPILTPTAVDRRDDAPMGEDLIEDFAAYQRFRGFTPPTIRRRTWTLTHLDAHSERPLLEVTRDDIIGFLTERPSAATRYSLMSDIRQFFRWAIMFDHTLVDPTLKIDKIRKPQRDPTPLTVGHVHRAIGAARPRTRLMIMLGAYAGLRVSEIARLHIDDLAHPGVVVIRQGKGSKDRLVPLAPELDDELQLWVQRGRCADDGHLFRGATPGGVSSSIRNVFHRLDIPNRPHDLRATFATTTAQRSNGNLVKVAELLGHAAVTTTQRYVRWNPDTADLVQALYPPTDAA